MRLITILFCLLSMAATGQQSFFSTSSGICFVDNPVELGLKFTTSANATIKALRFYKCSPDLGTYTVKLYGGSSIIASANFTGSATGWVSVPIPETVVSPGIAYIVSYFAPTGRYQAVNTYTFPVNLGSLKGTGCVYRYGAGNTPPAGVYQTSNYFADVVLKTDTAPPPPVVPQDSVYISGVLYLKASTIKKDTAYLPVYCPDSSWIFMDGYNPSVIDSTYPNSHVYERYEISMPFNQRIAWELHIEKLWKRKISTDGGVTWREE